MALDANGLTIRRLPEVIADIVTSEQQNINANIATDDDTFLGQLNTIFAAAIADQEALAQAVYDNFNPLKAEGKNLDDLAALIGITRITGAVSTTSTQEFVGNNGVTVPASTILQNPITLDRFFTEAAVLLDVASCISAKYSVVTLLNNTTYTLTVNTVDYSYLSDSDATALEILNGLEALITADATATWAATVDTINEQLNIATSDTANITISSTTFIGPDEVVNAGTANAEFEGAVVAPANSVTGIVTAVSGLTSTTNPDSYTIGRDRETDEELRARLLTSQQISGVATVEAIQDSLRNVLGVTTATVVENSSILFADGEAVVTFTNSTNTVDLLGHTLVNGDPIQFSTTGSLPAELLPQAIQYWVVNATVNDFQVSLTKGGSVVTFTDDGSGTNSILIGRPPKSFESIVQGGTDLDVATEIWLTKPAGIQPFGSTLVNVTDSSGNIQEIGFTRPTEVNLAFEVEYTKYSEEVFPVSGEVTMAQTVLDVTEALGIDEDVIPSRYFGDIYSAVSGVNSLVVKVQVIANPGDTPNPASWQTTKLAIDLDGFANTTSVDIVILEV